jgi:hypothetical protein
VIRRCRASLNVMVAALAIFLGLQPPSVHADGITSTTAGTADYTLTSTVNLTAPTGPVPGTPDTTLTGTVMSGSATVTVPSTTGLAVGYGVSGTGIPTGTTVTAINSTLSQVTLSQSATGAGSESLVFSPQTPVPQVFALVEPANGVVTPASSAAQGPLTILSASHGINSSGVYDFLASTTTNGVSYQAFGLSFYGNGLTAGGSLQFALNVSNQSSPPQLVSQTPGVTITLDPATSGNSGGGSGSSSAVADSVPEPLSLLLWSALAGAGLIRSAGWRSISRRLHNGRHGL